MRFFNTKDINDIEYLNWIFINDDEDDVTGEVGVGGYILRDQVTQSERV